MKKKGIAMQTIVVILILLVVFVLLVAIFLLPSGLVQKAAERSGVILTFLPGVEEPEPAGEVEVEGFVKDDFDKWVKIFQKYKDSPDEECFIGFPQFTDDWDENYMELNYLTKRKTLIIKLIAADGRTAKIVEIENSPELCLVAGTYDGDKVTERFYRYYLFGTARAGIEPEYTSINFLRIGGDEKDLSLRSDYDMDEEFEYEFQDVNEFYVLKSKQGFCFIQTEWTSARHCGEWNEATIDEDCITQLQEPEGRSVAYRLAIERSLDYCSP